MDKNDYGYKQEENIFLAMYDKNLSAYQGFEQYSNGGSSIVNNEYPLGCTTSLQINAGASVAYEDSKITSLGNSDFTLDFWMKYQRGYSGVSMCYIGHGCGIAIQPDYIWIGDNKNLGALIVHNSFKVNIWAHYAAVRKNNELSFFVDGKLIGRAPASMSIDAKSLIINARYLNGYTSEGEAHYKSVRLCNFARWEDSFTAPKATIAKFKCLYMKETGEVYGMKSIE